MAAPAKQITTSIGFQDAKGNVVANGMLMLTLSQTATVTATGGQVTTEPIYLTLDANGKITNTAIWFQDELSPSGTVYRGTVYASNKMRMIPGLENLSYSITGAGPFDLATAVQSATASPSYSGAVLLSPTADQTITQNNLLPGTDNSQSLGSAVKRWIGFFAAITVSTINKLTLTQPATGATLTILDGKTLKADNTLEFAGTDGTKMTLPGTSDTVVTLGATQVMTGKTLTAPVIGTTTISEAPRMTFCAHLVGGVNPETSGVLWARFIPDKPITVTRVMVVSYVAQAGASTNPQFQVTDGTTVAATITITNGSTALDSGALSVNYAAGVNLDIKCSTSQVGSGTVPSFNIIVEYKMQ